MGGGARLSHLGGFTSTSSLFTTLPSYPEREMGRWVACEEGLDPWYCVGAYLVWQCRLIRWDTARISGFGDGVVLGVTSSCEIARSTCESRGLVGSGVA